MLGEAGGILREALKILLRVGSFATLFTEEILSVDQLETEFEISLQVSIVLEIGFRRNPLAYLPAFALIDQENGRDLGGRDLTGLGQEVMDVGVLALAPELPEPLGRPQGRGPGQVGCAQSRVRHRPPHRAPVPG